MYPTLARLKLACSDCVRLDATFSLTPLTMLARLPTFVHSTAALNPCATAGSRSTDDKCAATLAAEKKERVDQIIIELVGYLQHPCNWQAAMALNVCITF